MRSGPTEGHLLLHGYLKATFGKQCAEEQALMRGLYAKLSMILRACRNISVLFKLLIAFKFSFHQ